MPAPGQICTQATADNVVAALEAAPAAFPAHPDQPGNATQFAIHAGGGHLAIATMTGPLAGARVQHSDATATMAATDGTRRAAGPAAQTAGRQARHRRPVTNLRYPTAAPRPGPP